MRQIDKVEFKELPGFKIGEPVTDERQLLWGMYFQQQELKKRGEDHLVCSIVDSVTGEVILPKGTEIYRYPLARLIRMGIFDPAQPGHYYYTPTQEDANSNGKCR